MRHLGHPYSARTALQAVFADAPHPQRAFHDYFVTHLPTSSVAPDNRQGGAGHGLPRNESQPHSGPTRSATQIAQAQAARETTIVRIPIKSAKHHFGAGVSRGGRPYNEDTYQAGTIEMPAFAKRQPISLSIRADGDAAQPAKSQSGDPQVFYFGVFDGHGGSECSDFLRDRLHGYVEESALIFGMESSLQKDATDADEMDLEGGVMGEQDSEDLQKSLVSSWKETVGGYFKRFKPEYFPALHPDAPADATNSSIETILTYAFLRADLDFTIAQAKKNTEEPKKKRTLASSTDDPVLADRPLNDNDVLFHPSRPASQNLRSTSKRHSATPDLKAPIGGSTRFKGGSTASIALISTPTPTPFWNPSSPCTLMVAHVGDTRVLLCKTADGKAEGLTTDHHPSAPVEATRLRRFAGAFNTDSFGEERMGGLANTRAFGDISSKRLGVSAEPQLTTVQVPPSQYSFLVLISDGVSGHLGDQEVVDIVKEAKTPAQGADALVSFAVETSAGEGGADNATALVVRLGGWERRIEGGGGSLGTKEQRDYRRREASDPRARRQ